MSGRPYNWIYRICPSKARTFTNLYTRNRRTTTELTWTLACIKTFYCFDGTGRFSTISNNKSLRREQVAELKTKLLANNGYSCQQILSLTRRYFLILFQTSLTSTEDHLRCDIINAKLSERKKMKRETQTSLHIYTKAVLMHKYMAHNKKPECVSFYERLLRRTVLSNQLQTDYAL